MKTANENVSGAGDPAVVPASLLEVEKDAHAGTKARLKLLEQSLVHYSPHELLGFLGKDSVVDVELGNHAERFMSILFADIRDFTSLSETMTPQQTFDMINSYLTSMSPVVSAYHGIIDKYIGDGIMALFPVSADAAVHAALALLARLDEYNAGRRRAGYQPIRIGIGVNTGILMLGMIGSQNRMEGTVISDAVNIAARLEALTKEYGVALLISEHTLYGLTDRGRFDVRYLGRVRVRGKSRGESIYEVFNHDDPGVRRGKTESMDDFDQAVAYYQLKQVDKALALFRRVSEKNPEDSPAKVYLSRCEMYLKHGVHEDTGELLNNVVWADDYRVGVGDIDRDHEEILNKVNQLLDAVRSGRDEKDIRPVMDSFLSEIRGHFDAEERLMVEHQYPFLSEHRNQHTAYRNMVSELLSSLGSGGVQREYLSQRINRLMVEWLINHTIQIDRHLARFLKERGL